MSAVDSGTVGARAYRMRGRGEGTQSLFLFVLIAARIAQKITVNKI